MFEDIKEKKKNLNYSKAKIKTHYHPFFHKDIIELELNMQNEITEFDVYEMIKLLKIAVEFYANKTDEKSVWSQRNYENKLREFMTDKFVMKYFYRKKKAIMSENNSILGFSSTENNNSVRIPAEVVKPFIHKDRSIFRIHKIFHNLETDSDTMIKNVEAEDIVDELIWSASDKFNIAENMYILIMEEQKEKFDKKLQLKRVKKTPSRARKKPSLRLTKFSSDFAAQLSMPTLLTPRTMKKSIGTSKQNHTEINFGFKKFIAENKQPKVSIPKLADEYINRILSTIKVSYDEPINLIVSKLNNHLIEKIKLHETYSDQTRELEILGTDANPTYRKSIQVMICHIALDNQRELNNLDLKFNFELEILKTENDKKYIIEKQVSKINEDFINKLLKRIGE